MDFIWVIVVIGHTWTIYSHDVSRQTRHVLDCYDNMRENEKLENAMRRSGRERSRSRDGEGEGGEVPRGGGRKRPPDLADSRSQMIAWAMQKATQDCPGTLPSTLRMLLRAELRTVKATLSCRSAAQTREVISAAMHRAGPQPNVLATTQAPPQMQVDQGLQHPQPQLSTPQQTAGDSVQSPSPQQQQGLPHHLSAQLDMLTSIMMNQVELTGKWMESQATTSNAAQYVSMVSILQQHNENQLSVIRGLAEAITKVEERVQLWETHLLPHVIDRIEELRPTESTRDPGGSGDTNSALCR